MNNTGLRHASFENALLQTLSSAPSGASPVPLERVTLRAGQPLYDCGARITHVYFPATAVISLALMMEDGATMEVSAVGCEGLVGLPALMGSDVMTSRAEVQMAGWCYRIEIDRLRQQFAESTALRSAILLYAQAFLTEVSQSSACNRHHTVSQQLCRWLLVAIDRAGVDQLPVTQQMIANILGVRREGVSEVTGRLVQAGLIWHRRGRLGIRDRPRLQAACCECYDVVHAEYARLRQSTRLLMQIEGSATAQTPGVDRAVAALDGPRAAYWAT